MEPISTFTSINFIERELIKRNDLNIIWSRDHYIKYMANDRDLKKFAKNISDIALKRDIFPLYVLLNVTYDKKDNKHSELIVITKYNEDFSVGFFDSNGKLSTKFGPDKNTTKILNYLSENLNTTYYEFMEGKMGINTIGKGNCDSYCLWFIYINKKSKTKTEICENFNDFYGDIKKENIKDITLEINKKIIELSKKR
jgi:hypothetical protein